MLANVLGEPEVTKLCEINVQVTEPPMQANSLEKVS